MSSMNANAENSESKPKSGNDPLDHEGGDSSAASEDPNKSKTVSSDDDLSETNKEKEEEDCEECWLSRYLKKAMQKEMRTQSLKELEQGEEAAAAAKKKEEEEETKGK